MEDDVGSAGVGKKADIILVDICPHLYPANICRHVVNFANGNDVDVDGDGRNRCGIGVWSLRTQDAVLETDSMLDRGGLAARDAGRLLGFGAEKA
jgi:hypothetical protein